MLLGPGAQNHMNVLYGFIFYMILYGFHAILFGLHVIIIINIIIFIIIIILEVGHHFSSDSYFFEYDFF